MGLELGVLFHRDGGFACVDLATCQIGGHSGTSGEDGFCAHRDMSADSGLGGNGDVILDATTACQSTLGNDEAMFANNDVVSDLDEVVDFCSFADDGLSEARTINGGVGADLHVVADFDDADLVDFDVAAVGELVAVTIGTDDGSGVNDHIVTEDAAFGDSYVGADLAVLADLCMFVNDGVGADFRSLSDGCSVHDDRSGVDANPVRIELGKIGYHGGWVDAGFE